MKNIQNKLLALFIMLMTVPMIGSAQVVSSHAHYFVNSVCKSCGFQKKLASTNVGAVGILDGREAIVVELNVNGVTKKVAVATMNVGATSVDEGAGTDAVAPCHGKMFTFADANDASKTGLSDGWYVPSKGELEALMNKCSWNGTKKGLELSFSDYGTSLFLPVCGFTNPNATSPVYRAVHADYWASTEYDSSKGWNLFFNANGKEIRGFDKTYKFNVRPFHELGEISGIQLTPTGANVEGFSGESYYKAFDGITTNKWCGQKTGDAPYVEFKSPAPTTIESYYIYTGNDINASGIEGVRNPMSWALFAKTNPTDSWTAISTVDDGELPTTYSTKKEFLIDPAYRNYSYQYFKLVIYYTTTKQREYIFEVGEIGIEAEHIHDYPAGKVVCNVCGHVKTHDHVYVNCICTKCGEVKKFASTTAGEVGMLDGREAIVVDLNVNGVTKKVAVTTENFVYGDINSTYLSFSNVEDLATTTLKDSRWYVPSKAELEALASKLTWNATKKGGELNFPSLGTTLFFPAAGWISELSVVHDNGVGYYWSSTQGTSSKTAYLMRISDTKIEVNEDQRVDNVNVRLFYEVEISGNTNSSVRWKLNFLTNTLTFEGTGSTSSTSMSNTYNWEDYKDRISNVVFGEGITEISEGCFMGMNIESVSFPSTLKTINRTAFKNCVKIKEVTLPASLTNIYSDSFSGCTNLTKLTYGAGTREVLRAYLTNVTTVVLPNSVTKIGSSAFYQCAKLQSIVIPDGVTEIGKYAFEGCSNLLSIDIPNNVTKIGEAAFNGCSNLQELNLPTSMESIDYYAFQGCKELQKVILPGSLTKISSSTFNGCTNLQQVTLPNTLEEIEASAFLGCKNLASIDLPANLKVIRSSAFGDCAALQSITIPSTVTSVGSNAFGNTSNLKNVIIEGSPYLNENAFTNCSALQVVELKVEQSFDSHSAAFTNCSSSCVLHVPAVLYEWATVTAPWSGFIIRMNENLMIVNADDTRSIMYFDPDKSDNEWELVDGLKSLKVFEDINMSSLTYKRNFSSTTWQSLFVPFDIEVTEDVLSMCDIAFPYMVSTKGSTNGGMQEAEKGLDALVLMKLESGETAHANTPYFIRAKNTGAFELTVENTILHNTDDIQTVECETVFDEYQFIGQYAQGKPEAGTTWYAITPSGSLAMGGDSSPALGAMRSYMTKSSKNYGAAPAQAKAMRILTFGEDSEATAIVTAHADATDSSKTIYSISGIRLSKPQKGLNIIGGKKVVIK